MSFQAYLKKPFLGIACTALLTTACSTTQNNMGFGGTLGTTGVGVEAKYAASNHIAVRGSVATLPITRDESFDGVDYEADVDLTTFGGFADVYPFKNGLHLSGGVYAGDKAIDLVGVPGPTTVVEIGNTTYTGAEIGTLVGDVQYNDIAPFVGIGYDGFMNRGNTWSFNARAGVMFVGAPDVTLDAEGGLSSDFPSVQTELEREAQNLEDELDKYKYYPVVTVGVTRRF